jgi:hypothetical protein
MIQRVGAGRDRAGGGGGVRGQENWGAGAGELGDGKTGRVCGAVRVGEPGRAPRGGVRCDVLRVRGEKSGPSN